jgi:hypothetical protein
VSNLLFDLWLVSLVIFFVFLVYGLLTLGLTGLSFVEEVSGRSSAASCSGPCADPSAQESASSWPPTTSSR